MQLVLPVQLERAGAERGGMLQAQACNILMKKACKPANVALQRKPASLLMLPCNVMQACKPANNACNILMSQVCNISRPATQRLSAPIYVSSSCILLYMQQACACNIAPLSANICVFTLPNNLYMCPHTAIYVSSYVSSYCYTRVLMLVQLEQALMGAIEVAI